MTAFRPAAAPKITVLLALLCCLPATATAVDGRALYEEHCAKCHGATGAADTWRGRLYFARDFTAAKWQAATGDDEILRDINRGPRIMPAYERTLTAQERQALVEVVRGFGKR